MTELEILQLKVPRYEMALKAIALSQTLEELQNDDIGLTYEEHLEMAYENLRFEAQKALIYVKGTLMLSGDINE